MIFHGLQRRMKGFTLTEVLIASAIFATCLLVILNMVAQSMELVKTIRQQRPDLGALAGRTLVELPAPDGELTSGLSEPSLDSDFGGNGGGADALYPDAYWERELYPLDETNGLYAASIFVQEQTLDGEPNETRLNFLMFRPDLAEAEQAGSAGAGAGGASAGR